MFAAMKTVLYPDTPVQLHLWKLEEGQKRPSASSTPKQAKPSWTAANWSGGKAPRKKNIAKPKPGSA